MIEMLYEATLDYFTVPTPKWPGWMTNVTFRFNSHQYILEFDETVLNHSMHIKATFPYGRIPHITVTKYFGSKRTIEVTIFMNAPETYFQELHKELNEYALY